ncbi:MAG: putative transposase [Bacteroidia bacterium]|jgi:putative transposase
MLARINSESCYFFTATVKSWYCLLNRDQYKKIITDSLAFLVKDNRVRIYGFVIMPNHLHVIWDILQPHTKAQIQRDFLKYTSQQMRLDMMQNHPSELLKFRVDLKDRKHQIWQRRSLSIQLYSISVFEQKLNYIHNNPISGKWRLADIKEDYPYSSASLYSTGQTQWNFLTNFYIGD